MNELRLSGGLLRGRKIAVPDSARPTEGRVREALFSIWAPAVEGARLLDLFAGSGAVAFEALSRGARGVVLVDESREVTATLTRNRDKLGIDPAAAVIVRAELPTGKLSRFDPFDLVFADPPYAFDRHADLLAMVKPLLAEGGELVLEHSFRTALPDAAAGLFLNREKIYGGSALGFYRAADSL